MREQRDRRPDEPEIPEEPERPKRPGAQAVEAASSSRLWSKVRRDVWSTGTGAKTAVEMDIEMD
eukprot:1362976-Heterocapsa_arctica.AAC.1